jgi:hypothetical protein
VQQQVFDAFGGKRGQWVVLVADPILDAARARGDRLVSARGDEGRRRVGRLPLRHRPRESHAEGALAARDALDLPAKSDELERALRTTGFAVDRFEDAIASMKSAAADLVNLEALRTAPPRSS